MQWMEAELALSVSNYAVHMFAALDAVNFMSFSALFMNPAKRISLPNHSACIPNKWLDPFSPIHSSRFIIFSH